MGIQGRRVGKFKYFSLLKIGMFPMTQGGRDGQIAHALRGMGWGSCEPPELPDEALAVKAGGTGEAPSVRAGVVHPFYLSMRQL